MVQVRPRSRALLAGGGGGTRGLRAPSIDQRTVARRDIFPLSKRWTDVGARCDLAGTACPRAGEGNLGRILPFLVRRGVDLVVGLGSDPSPWPEQDLTTGRVRF